MKKIAHNHWARIGVLLLAVLLIGAVCFVGYAADEMDEAPECYEHGDVNGDGVVDNRDALYLLDHPEEGEDYDGDGDVDTDDALYLLNAFFFTEDEDYQLEGHVHEYYAPDWSWDTENGTATAVFRCACGKEDQTQTLEAAVSVDDSNKASHTEPGSVVYTATVERGGVTYTDTYTVVLDPTGHDTDLEWSYDDDAHYHLCCGEMLDVTAHEWKLDEEASTAATCDQGGVQVYTCDCGATKQVTTEPTGHSYNTYAGDRAIDDCHFVKQYQCACGAVTDGTAESDSYTKHSYANAVAQQVDATCVTKGSKTYTCDNCSEPHVVEIPVNGNHNWVLNEGSTTDYTCAYGCGATKTVMVEVENINTSDLSADTELVVTPEKGGTEISMSMNEAALKAVQQAGTITLKVDELTTSQVEDQIQATLTKESIDDVVYDISMVDENGNKVFTEAGNGAITVSVPYTLSEGEDVDTIDVFYIDSEGNYHSVQGSYSNGFVTFTVEHFSYYTVTRLTNAERCDRYGHFIVDVSRKATCTEDGIAGKQICQRCNETIEEGTAVSAAGHAMQLDSELSKTADCTHDGVEVYKCTNENCHYATSKVTPAKGHSMNNGEIETAASCTKVGKLVYTCTVDGCGHTTTQTLPMLVHEYVLSETVDPTCTVEGYESWKCTCGAEEKRNKTAALGHSFSAENALWEWAEDMSSAALTLTCEHNTTHVRTLKAVVTASVAGESSCTQGGSTVYTAVAVYNGTTYTETKEIAGASAGHKSDSIWHYDGGKHYHLCTVCGAVTDDGDHTAGDKILYNGTQHYQECTVCSGKVNAVNHTMDDGEITVQPTCDTVGKKVYSCSGCSYQKTELIAPTGVHTYEDGVCTVCGHQDNANCDHTLSRLEYVNMDQYGVCPGAEICVVSCECGADTRMQIEDMYCELNEPEIRIDTAADGSEYEVYVFTCPNCGLVVEARMDSVLDEENCVASTSVSYQFMMNGETIIQARLMHEYETGTRPHPMVRVEETVDLEGTGMCGGQLVITSCSCGKHHSVEEDLACEWNYEGYENGVERLTCLNCGAEKQVTYTYAPSEEEPCIVNNIEQVVYSLKGVEIYSGTSVSAYFDHDYEPTNVRLYGDSCEDGVFFTAVCRNCGDSQEQFITYHGMMHSEYIDLSGRGLCLQSLVQWSCACEKKLMNCDVAYGQNSCNWISHTEDSEICTNCGVIRTTSMTATEKDENCESIETYTYTYQLEDGTILAVGMDRGINQKHVLHTEYTLLGDSCEDGVTISESCQDCDYSRSFTVEHHYTFVTDSIDLEALGACGGAIDLRGCACGESRHTNYRNMSCSFVPHTGFENGYSEICTECEIVIGYTYDQVDSGEPCKVVENCTISVSREGTVLDTMSYQQISENHDILYTYTLVEGGTTCDDGYYLHGECLRCDETRVYDEIQYGHSNRMIGYETIVESGLCGKRIARTYGCACGEESRVEYDWEDGNCDFWHNRYLEEEGCDEFVCANCGGSYRHYNTRQQEDGSCQFLDINRYVYFDAAGNQLGEHQYTRNAYDHNYVHTLTLVEGGTTCSDGYYRSATCIRCGESFSDSGLYWDCNGWLLNSEVLSEGELCGTAVLNTYGCACGERHWQELNWEDGNCYWSHIGYDEDGDNIYRCETCQNQRVEKLTRTKGEEPCQMVYSWEYVYLDAEGTELFRWNEISYGSNHKYTYTYELLGETCADGYYITQSCQVCGNSSDWGEEIYYGCVRRPVERETLLQAPCGDIELVTSSCACGAEAGKELYSECQWNYAGYDEKMQMERFECTACGTMHYTTGTTQRVPEECKAHETRTYIFQDAEGNELLNTTVETEYTSHTSSTVFHLLGESCEDGYTYTINCKYCGVYMGENNEVQTGHSMHQVERYDLSAYTECGGYIYKYACPCGEYSYYEDNIWCSWNHQDTAEDGTDHYLCEGCGSDFYLLRSSKRDPETCISEGVFNYRLVISGETVFEVGGENRLPSHEYTAVHMELMDSEKGCEGGYLVTMQCTCGDSHINEGYSHESHITGRITTDCGTELYIFSCACGENQNIETNNWCDMTGSSSAETDENGFVWECYTQTCKNCGLQIINKYRYEYPEDSCYGTTYRVKLAILNGETVGQAEWSYESEDHDYEYHYSLSEGSTTCEDGLDVTATCKRCNHVRTSQIYHHAGNSVQYVEFADHGACGGYFEYLECPCGQLTWNDWGVECEHTQSKYVTETDENGNVWSGDRRTCTECGLAVTMLNYSYIPEGSCYGTWYETVTVTMGETQLAYGEESGDSESHDDETFCYLLEGSTTCEDGIHVTRTCRRCARVSEYDTDYHYTYRVQRVELAEHGACEGYYDVYSCACGDEKYSNNNWGCGFGVSEDWSETDSEGLVWSCSESSCNECGLVVTHKWADVYPEGSCYGTSYRKTILTMNGSQILLFEDMDTCESHDDSAVYTLPEGHTSCEDGVEVTYTCNRCGRVENTTQHHHEQHAVDRFDLASQGSVCGGELVLYSCACGTYHSVEFSEDTECDFGSYSIEHWIEGVVHDSQYTTEGWVNTYSYSEKYTCAVTDPQCGFELRSSRYYLVENCWATQYICWQYYDGETGAWVDIFHEPTGQAHAYHEYETTSTTLEGDTGYDETKQVCKHCQSSNTERNYYENGEHVAYEFERINTKDNGERQRYYHINRYTKLHADVDYNSTLLERSEYTYADGSEYWYQNEWNYDLENGCTATRTYTNSNGVSESYEEEVHAVVQTYTEEEPTCSQFGLQKWVWTCLFCGEVTDVDEYDVQPTDHNWYWSDDLQTYYCADCGVHNANGASGSIIMQDMSSDEDYIVGYWNRGNVDFSTYVMLVRYDENGAITDEVALDVAVSYSERENHVGFTAAIVNKAEAIAQAEALMSGESYVGDYAIRVTFVPATDAYDLDYAVTFETLYYNYNPAE